MAIPPLSFSGGASAPSGARSDNVFDSSGWVVSTGSSTAGGAVNPYLIGAALLAATLIAIVWLRK
jgi:hypothetical protein